MLNAQNITDNSETGKDRIIQTSRLVVLKQIKDPPTWLEVATVSEIDPTFTSPGHHTIVVLTT